MTYELKTDLVEVDSLLDGLEAFVVSCVEPLERDNDDLLTDERAKYRSDGRYTQEIVDLKRRVRQASAEAGFFTMCVPTEMGGGGQGALLHLLAWERLYHRFGPGRLLVYESFAHWGRGPSHVLKGLTPELQETFLPPLARGDVNMCFALSEPDAGTDAWNLRTRAERSTSGWVLNGTKQWTSNAPTADYALVFAVTDLEQARDRRGGVTAFLVPTSSPGFQVDSVLKIFGHAGGDEAILSFSDVEVPDSHIVGDVDRGFDIALEGISFGRMYNAGRALGSSRWALELAIEHAKSRVTFGQPIAENQGIQFPLAEAATKLYAARSMTLDCARKIEAGERVRKELSMVKQFTAQTAFEVHDIAMQIHGAMGFTNEMRLHHGWHNARVARVAEGSIEIMKRDVARRLLRGDVSF